MREAAARHGPDRAPDRCWRVELPLALPAIIAGLRIATVTVISLATVAAFVVNEGLGAPIFDAIQRARSRPSCSPPAAWPSLLALLADALLVVVQRLAHARGRGAERLR